MMALGSRRLIFLVVSGLAGLLVAAAAVFYFLLKANLNKARLEATASAALGMELRIGGPLGTGFFPGLLVTLQDVRIRNRELDVASAQQASLQIELLPLLKNEVRITKIALKHPVITIQKGRDGHFNLEQPQARGGVLPGLDWPIVSISDATLVYANKRLEERFEAHGCNVDVRDLRLAGGTPSSLMKDLAFTAKLTCAKLLRDGFTVSDLKFSADAKNGVFELTPVTAQVFGTQGSGRIHADFSKATPVYQVHYSLPQFPIEEFLETMSAQKVATGRMDFSANLSMQGTTEKQMRQTANGQVSLRGSNLTLSGIDLDRAFARFESSQNFSLVDVGAFFFVGPLGLVVTRGLNLATIQQDYPGNSEIRTLVSQWKVERGVARAQDVAMATKENRVALQGGLDFVDNRFDDLTVALIDAKGCATVRQHVHGTFAEPVVDKPNRLEALAGPVLRLLKKGSQILGGEGCDVFYAGSVAAPK